MAPEFTTPPNREAFDRQVWEYVRRVPPGRVVTYGQIAAAVAPPQGIPLDTYRAFGARWVGSAMAHCPENVPWQRVVNAQGKISLRRGAGPERQRFLLETEGVEFNPAGRINLAQYGWEGPPPQVARTESWGGEVMAGRLFLIHWHEEEATAYQRVLQEHGWQIVVEARDGGRAASRIKADQPHGVIIFLTRKPSHGRHMAIHLRSQSATREIPIIFVGGDMTAVERTQVEVPGAVFTSHTKLAEILEEIIELEHPTKDIK